MAELAHSAAIFFVELIFKKFLIPTHNHQRFAHYRIAPTFFLAREKIFYFRMSIIWLEKMRQSKIEN